MTMGKENNRNTNKNDNNEGKRSKEIKIKKLPKIELHAHLSGSVPQEKLLQILERRLSTAKSQKERDYLKDLKRHFPIQYFLDDEHDDNQDDDRAATTGTNEGNCTNRTAKEESNKSSNNNNGINYSNNNSRTIQNAFKYFELVKAVITDLKTLREATLFVLEAYREENCIYLELRTSPKEFVVWNDKTESHTTTTKTDYIRTVVEAIEEFGNRNNINDNSNSNGKKRDMLVRILPSVDRGKIKDFSGAWEQLQDIYLLKDRFPEYILGIDICGNPLCDSVRPYLLPAIDQIVTEQRRQQQRSNNINEKAEDDEILPITFHLGEHRDDEEIDAVLDKVEEYNIQRLGHVCYLRPHHREKLQTICSCFKRNIGIELCPTSNRITTDSRSYKEHHFPLYYSPRYKENDNGNNSVSEGSSSNQNNCGCFLVSLNADDIGLFDCNLTHEIVSMVNAFELTENDLLQLQLNAVETCFLPTKEKDCLRQSLILDFRKILDSSS